MPLKMKQRCEKCKASLRADAEAYICSYECTFCGACASAMARVCPNCDGELVSRPRRTTPVLTVAARSSRRWLARLFKGAA